MKSDMQQYLEQSARNRAIAEVESTQHKTRFRLLAKLATLQLEALTVARPLLAELRAALAEQGGEDLAAVDLALGKIDAAINISRGQAV